MLIVCLIYFYSWSRHHFRDYQLYDLQISLLEQEYYLSYLLSIEAKLVVLSQESIEDSEINTKREVSEVEIPNN